MIINNPNNNTKDLNSLIKNLAFKYVSRYFVNSHKLKKYLLRKLTNINLLNNDNYHEIDSIINEVINYFTINKYINNELYNNTKSLSLIKKGKSLNYINNKMLLDGVKNNEIKASINKLSNNNSYNLELLSAIYFLQKKRLGAFYLNNKPIKLPKNQAHLTNESVLIIKTKDTLYKNGFSNSVINDIIKLSLTEINLLKEELINQIND